VATDLFPYSPLLFSQDVKKGGTLPASFFSSPHLLHFEGTLGAVAELF
jgi:hypothetical protein